MQKPKKNPNINENHNKMKNDFEDQNNMMSYFVKGKYLGLKNTVERKLKEYILYMQIISEMSL